MADPAPPLGDLLADQRRRWRAGDGLPVEAYQSQHPALRDDDEAVRDLVANEIALRGQLGHTLEVFEYVTRFPALAVAIAHLFRVWAASYDSPTLDLPAAEPASPRPPREPPGPPPRVVGYELLEYLGGSPRGTVWKARQLLFDRVVALKILRVTEAEEVDTSVRFQRASRSDLPGVVPFYDRRTGGGNLCLVSEYAPHGSLADRLAAIGLPPANVGATLLAALARAVYRLHELGIAHRNLRPSNVLFGVDGAAKVADFCLPVWLRAQNFHGQPVPAAASYLAPEQAFERDHSYDLAPDVYALGAILYECLTGRPPFAGESWQQLADRVQFRAATPPSFLRDGVPAPLERICLKCLEKCPDDRYPSAAALADDLQRFLDGQPVEAPGEAPASAVDNDTADTVSAEDRATFPRIPGYEILAVLARRPFGAVYKARMPSLRRVVALKTFRHDYRDGGGDLSVLREEPRLMILFKHANIARLYDVGDHGGLTYFAVEYLPGGDLNGVLKRAGPPTYRQAAELVETLAWAAGRIHRHDFVHCDLTPGSILVAPPGPKATAAGEPTAEQRYGTPKIARFEIVHRFRNVPEPPADSLVSEGVIEGVARYMPPERVIGKRDAITPATDVWSLGVLLYELLTGNTPFAGETLFDLVNNMMNNPPPPPRTVRPEVPRGLEAICSRCLERDPQRRYASGTELAEALRAFLADPGAKETDDGARAGGLWRRLRFWNKS